VTPNGFAQGSGLYDLDTGRFATVGSTTAPRRNNTRRRASRSATRNWATTRIEGPTVLKPVDEAGLSTNASAQYGLAAIQCPALIGDRLPG
jgi:hypothetical protein